MGFPLKIVSFDIEIVFFFCLKMVEKSFESALPILPCILLRLIGPNTSLLLQKKVGCDPSFTCKILLACFCPINTKMYLGRIL